MTSDPRVRLRDHLPDIYRAHDIDGVDNRFTQTFLAAFEVLFEDLQSKIEGAPGEKEGGIPDLFSLKQTPPPQYLHPQAEQENLTYLSYLASWIGLPMRVGKDLAWNRKFVQEAIQFYPLRGTLDGMEGILRAWLEGDIEELRWQDGEAQGNLLPLIADLTRLESESDSLFQIHDVGETVRLGIDSVLGEGLPFFFVVDMTLSLLEGNTQREPRDVEALVRTAQQLLDAEKPAHTYYQLRVRAQRTADGLYETWTFDSDLEVVSSLGVL